MRHLLATLSVILLLGLVACGNDGPIATGETGPTIPPPGTNPGGVTYQLQVTIDLTKTSGSAPLPINMSANIIGGEAPFYYRWDVKDDGKWDFFGPQYHEIGITYASAGLYHITLEVEDLNGQFYRAYAQIEVKNSGPTAMVHATPSKGAAPLTVLLDGNWSYDNDGEVVLWEWDIESDGIWDHESVDNGLQNTIYHESGTYNATLRVTDNDGLTAVSSVQIIAL